MTTNANFQTKLITMIRFHVVSDLQKVVTKSGPRNQNTRVICLLERIMATGSANLPLFAKTKKVENFHKADILKSEGTFG